MCELNHTLTNFKTLIGCNLIYLARVSIKPVTEIKSFGKRLCMLFSISSVRILCNSINIALIASLFPSVSGSLKSISSNNPYVYKRVKFPVHKKSTYTQLYKRIH